MFSKLIRQAIRDVADAAQDARTAETKEAWIIAMCEQGRHRSYLQGLIHQSLA